MSRTIQILGSVALVLSISSGARAAFITVTDFVDDFDDGNGTCSIREAMRAANGNVVVDACQKGSATQTDHILVSPGTHVVDLGTGVDEDASLTGDLDVLEPVIIRGATAEFSRIEGLLVGTTDRLFHVLPGAGVVRFERVALRNGAPQDTLRLGGVVWNQNSNTTFDEIELSDGTARRGGGVYNDGSLTIRHSRIFGNQTVVDGASTTNRGGGITSEGGDVALVVADSEISGNQADDDGGGAFVGGGVQIYRSEIVDNDAGDQGGGLYLASDDFLVDYVEVARNEAAQGGGMYLALPGEVKHSAILDNDATSFGGGIADAMDGKIRLSTISGNSAPLGAGVHANSNQTLIDASTIARNQGDGVHNVVGAFFENTIVAENSGGNCTGAAPGFGAFNIDHANTCSFVSSPMVPNFPNTDPLLGVLGNHGGPTPTLPLLAGSPAIDASTSDVRMNCENLLDQRGRALGRPRTDDGMGGDLFHCDLGAFELTAPFVVDSLVDAPDADVNDDTCETAAANCTLRAAIQQANAIPGLVEVELGAGSHTLQLAGVDEDLAATGDLDIEPPIEIRGAGATLSIVDGASLDRVFQVGDGSTPMTGSLASRVSLFRNLTVSGGGNVSRAAGILAYDDLRLEHVVLSNNTAPSVSALDSPLAGRRVEIVDSTVRDNQVGRAIFARDARIERSSLIDNTSQVLNGAAGEFTRVRLKNSTVSGNDAESTGAFFASEALVDSSAIFDNTSDFAPGGVFLLELSLFRNSIVADNRVTGVSNNCSLNPLAATSYGFNLTDTDASDCTLIDPSDLVLTNPMLAALADNGGPTLTHLPLAGSPAIDQGDVIGCPAEDQRGNSRPRDGDENGSVICDIGPVEVPEPGMLLALPAGLLLLGYLTRRRSRPEFSRRGSQ